MRKWLCAFLAVILAFSFFGCGGDELQAHTDSYYITGSKDEQEKLRNYFYLLEGGTESAPEQFAIVREIANTFAMQKEYDRLINFLGARLHEYPDDPYNPYYLLMTAFAYQQKDANPVAALYFDRIVKNYPDLKISGNSIHLACLKQLITLTGDPQQRKWYYEELITRFLDEIDPGPAFFVLGQAYESAGEWSSAVKAYTEYLPYVGSNVPGFPNADNYARQLVDFNNSPKDWTSENLNTLVDAIINALDSGSATQLRRYHAKVNFFSRTWEQEDSFDSVMTEFNLADFMRGSRIRHADTLDVSSTANEAYLRTWGWSGYIPTWYLYFRKIYFPSNPEIHGRWEWAGVYYGEKF